MSQNIWGNETFPDFELFDQARLTRGFTVGRTRKRIKQTTSSLHAETGENSWVITNEEFDVVHYQIASLRLRIRHNSILCP